ncbi:hypothetical protein O6H91_18G085800 [Diphasiastrum complanatum]|uniref:Uncharacterized protein n=1 Tax=Diphasiastrum complanatum TaxID=34168 RepID=A0ACC2B3H2_DIPCM|nr:hypothetical protein O6H91_18G085800 [Diphasiastrum complanatum]
MAMAYTSWSLLSTRLFCTNKAKRYSSSLLSSTDLFCANKATAAAAPAATVLYCSSNCFCCACNGRRRDLWWSWSSGKHILRCLKQLQRNGTKARARASSVRWDNPSKRLLSTAASAVEVGGVTISRDEVVKEEDPTNNVPDTIFSKIGMQLHKRPDHPLGILKNVIYNHFDERYPGLFHKFDDLSPIVSIKENFDDVLVPSDHVSRSYNDTYYINSETVLRCHTSAHQGQMLRDGYTHFLVSGDVYRRDAIDATHYPIFHQMEGFRVFTPNEWEKAGLDGTTLAANELKETLEGLAKRLFGNVETRWTDSYFPFTDPSYELEIFFKEKWLEVLGCGVTKQEILTDNGQGGKTAWAFGLGLERLAMVLFDIPDIRLFWSSDPRFTAQFTAGQLGIKFKPFSKFPPCYKDISFWISDAFTENNLCEVVRGIAGDLVEEANVREEAQKKLNVILR